MKKLGATNLATVTQRELARITNVSYVTVNKALNDKEGVDPQTRQRILETARRLGYRKNLVARSLVTRRTNIIGLVLCGTQNSFFGQVAGGIQSRARELGYHVLLADSENNPNIEVSALESMLDIRTSGIIVQPAPEQDNIDIYYQLRQNGVKLLAINNRNDAITRNFIGTDDECGAMQAVEYLVKLGHRRIAHIGWKQCETSGQNRFRGYQRAMERAALQINPRWVICERTDDHGYVAKITEELMSLSPRPTAIFAATDGIAMVTIQKLLSMGLRVPADVSVIGYANMPECVYSAIPLTTMDQHPYQMGCRAIELLINIIEDKSQEPCVEILKDTLIERSSCASPVPET